MLTSAYSKKMPVRSNNSFLYYIFSVFCKHSYIGETIDMIRRKLLHTRQASKSYHSSFLYSILHSIGIEHFTFLCTPIPHYLRKPLEHQLISWFKPSLNTLHNSNFKSDIYSNPSIPDILKSAVIAFKSSNPHSLSSYNINSPNFKTPTAFCNQIKRQRVTFSSSSASFTQYHDPCWNVTSINLLGLISECCDKMTFKPFFVLCYIWGTWLHKFLLSAKWYAAVLSFWTWWQEWKY